MFILVVIGILFTVYGYFGWRLVPSFFPDFSAALIAWSAVTVLAAMPISFIWLRNRVVENALADIYA